MDTRVKGGMVEIVPREVTQAKLDRRSAAAMRHRASQTECLAERFEAIVAQHGARPFLFFGEERITYAQAHPRINPPPPPLRRPLGTAPLARERFSTRSSGLSCPYRYPVAAGLYHPSRPIPRAFGVAGF